MKKNLVKNFILLLKAKYKLSKPPTKNIIIFDIPLIKKINLNLGIRKKDLEILYVRGEVLNIYVIFKTLFELKLKFQDYIKNYIKIVNPKIVITFIDNSLFFYTLKKSFPNIKFISVQNGYRNRIEDNFNIFKKISQKLEVDYFFFHLGIQLEKNIQNLLNLKIKF
jgi:surface carbohydrate biosynthesis protein